MASPNEPENDLAESVVAHSFEQLTGSVYQIWLHLTEFTHCA